MFYILEYPVGEYIAEIEKESQSEANENNEREDWE